MEQFPALILILQVEAIHTNGDLPVTRAASREDRERIPLKLNSAPGSKVDCVGRRCGTYLMCLLN